MVTWVMWMATTCYLQANWIIASIWMKNNELLCDARENPMQTVKEGFGQQRIETGRS